MRSLLRTLAFGSTVAILVPASTLTAQASDRAIGAWTLDVAKSKYNLTAMPKSLTLTYTKTGQGLTVSTTGVDGQGNPTATGYTANYDGKDHPATGSGDYDTVSLTQVDASTVQATRKKAGKVVTTFQRVVSADGKVMTITTKGTNAKGQAATDVGVFDRQ
jgi:hypothetical protein